VVGRRNDFRYINPKISYTCLNTKPFGKENAELSRCKICQKYIPTDV